jgi:putative membrane protein
MRRILTALLFSTALVAGPALSQAPTAAARAGRDAGDAVAGPVGMASASTLGSMNASAYVMNAARSDMYEIAAGKLAEQRSHSDRVKMFARKMIHDHTQTTAQLKARLPHGMTLPTALDKRRSGMLDDLRASRPGEFDRRYADQQVAAHQEALTLEQGYAAHGDNPSLRQLAAQVTPTISEHLQMARQLAAGQGR